MLVRAQEIITDISKITDSVILMHSLSGKDSIALLDMIYPHFNRVVCVYMYMVPNLKHIAIYKSYAQRKYPNVEFMQCPHYAYLNYVKYGFMGMEANKNQREYKVSDIINKVREKTGIEWACLGFKQNDSLNRRLMLRSYKDGKESICWAGKKFYPLSTYSNKDVLDYIHENHLKEPESYGGIMQSSGTDITSYNYLKYLEKHFPEDLQKVNELFPMTKFIIPSAEKNKKWASRLS